MAIVFNEDQELLRQAMRDLMTSENWDNDAILEDLGYSESQIAELYNKGVIAKD